MGTIEILEKAIKKAEKNGYIPNFNWTFEKGKIIDNKNYYSIIFNHEFCKALWGEEIAFLPFSEIHKHIGENCILWKWHIKQMVVSENAIEYLDKNMDKDSWKYILKK